VAKASRENRKGVQSTRRPGSLRERAIYLCSEPTCTPAGYPRPYIGRALQYKFTRLTNMHLLVLCALPAATAELTAAPVFIGNSTQLFADDFIVDSMVNLTRSVHSPDCSHSVITPDAPWERNRAISTSATSIILDEDSGKLRVWYMTRNATLGCWPKGVPGCVPAEHLPPQPNFEEPGAGPVYMHYAESVDGGKTFIKPSLGITSIGGSTSNNVVLTMFDGGTLADGPLPTRGNGLEGEGFTVFIDPNQATGSAQRYRGITAGNLALTSPDGFNWTVAGVYNIPCLDGAVNTHEGLCPGTAPGHPVQYPANTLYNSVDTQGVIFFDPPCNKHQGCYSFYTRWYSNRTSADRQARRVRSKALTLHEIEHTLNLFNQSVGLGYWGNESIVLQADALDYATNPGPCTFHSNPEICPEWSGLLGPMDIYGSTPWYNAATRCVTAASVRQLR
jgi:hypothetical protein